MDIRQDEICDFIDFKSIIAFTINLRSVIFMYDIISLIKLT